jgi:hypothetical protein
LVIRMRSRLLDRVSGGFFVSAGSELRSISTQRQHDSPLKVLDQAIIGEQGHVLSPRRRGRCAC